MFKSLYAQLNHSQTVSLTITRSHDQLSLMVLPNRDGTGGLTVTGTPDELERDFGAVFAASITLRATVLEQLEQAKERAKGKQGAAPKPTAGKESKPAGPAERTPAQSESLFAPAERAAPVAAGGISPADTALFAREVPANANASATTPEQEAALVRGSLEAELASARTKLEAVAAASELQAMVGDSVHPAIAELPAGKRYLEVRARLYAFERRGLAALADFPSAQVPTQHAA